MKLPFTIVKLANRRSGPRHRLIWPCLAIDKEVDYLLLLLFVVNKLKCVPVPFLQVKVR